MATMQWSEQFDLGLGRMDETHREFITLYNEVAEASPDRFLERLDAFIAHTEAHFEQENRWMAQVDFPGCHRAEHDRVLVVMRDVRERVARGDAFLGRRLMEELPAWFDNHVSGMDAALAFHLDSIGFDVETGVTTPRPGAAGERSSGCGCAGTPVQPAKA